SNSAADKHERQAEGECRSEGDRRAITSEQVSRFGLRRERGHCLGICEMPPSENIEVFATVTDRTGNHRLVLQFVEVKFPSRRKNVKAYDFHSLCWQARDGATWTAKLVLSRIGVEQESP